jgi:hypothetical protein
MIVVFPAGDIGPCHRHILTARDFERPDRMTRDVPGFDHGRHKHGGDAKSDCAPF